MRTILAITITVLCAISACRTLQVENNASVDYDGIKNFDYLSCVSNALQGLQYKKYISTEKGYLEIQAGCYVYLKESGVLR